MIKNEGDVSEKEKTSFNNQIVSLFKNETIKFCTIGLLAIGVIYISINYSSKRAQNRELEKVTQQKPIEEIKRVDYREVTAPNFPVFLAIASGTKIIQSYSKSYPNGMYQSSALIMSEKSVFDNFIEYEKKLTKEGYSLLNKEKNQKLSKLFSVKASSTIEIQIRKTASSTVPGKSYVMINSYAK